LAAAPEGPSAFQGIRFAVNLQFFAEDEKTEEATPRKKEEARKKGQVPRSVELTMLLTLLASFLLLGALGEYFVRTWLGYLMEALSPDMLNLDLAGGDGGKLLLWHLRTFMMFFLPLGFGCMAVGVLVNFLQVGVLFTTEPLKPRFDRISPIQGFQRMFSTRSVVELVKSLIKLGVSGVILWNSFRNEMMPHTERAMAMTGTEAIAGFWQILYNVALRIILALLVLGVLDYLYQRWEYAKSLRMTKKELKDEYKQLEGDPQIKSRIKQRQRQLAMRRMMQDVPKADVVITNPTHYAVALRYDAATMAAPQVVAKGEGYLAARIREIAEENKVPLVENPPLARAIYKAVDVGGFIPAELYQAVAEVLAFVYRLQRRKIHA